MLNERNQIQICHLDVFTSASFNQTPEASCLPPPLRTAYIFTEDWLQKGFVLFHAEGCTVTVPGRCWLSVRGTKASRKWGLKSVTSQERGWALQLNVDLAQHLLSFVAMLVPLSVLSADEQLWSVRLPNTDEINAGLPSKLRGSTGERERRSYLHGSVTGSVRSQCSPRQLSDSWWACR